MTRVHNASDRTGSDRTVSDRIRSDRAALDRAVLVLEDGTRYRGRPWGARGRTLGEAVFATGMTGYQETLTDPSYAGQIVLMTAPHIGNTGVNDEDPESRRIWVAGFVAREPSRIVSNFRADGSLDDQLVKDGIVGISGIDTRAVTRRLRDTGSMRAGIFSGDDARIGDDEQLEIVRAGVRMTGLNLSSAVSVAERYLLPADGERIGSVAVLDLGVKDSTLRYLSARGFDVHVLPQSITIDDLRSLEPDAVFYSNGPGDPGASDQHVELLQAVLRDGLPFFGICFGNQLLGRALGYGTYKLPFGHRGINQPVVDTGTGRVEITSHNHGFAVDAPIGSVSDSPAGFGRVEVSHVNLNDDVVEGLNALDIPAFSVQYHPEAAAGPHDANYLFDRFRDMVLDQPRRLSSTERSEARIETNPADGFDTGGASRRPTQPAGTTDDGATRRLSSTERSEARIETNPADGFDTGGASRRPTQPAGTTDDGATRRSSSTERSEVGAGIETERSEVGVGIETERSEALGPRRRGAPDVAERRSGESVGSETKPAGNEQENN